MINKFIMHLKKEKFQNKMIDFIFLISTLKNSSELVEEINIKREEVSIMMKETSKRINIIKFDKEEWINDIEPDVNNYTLNKKATSREIIVKLLDYIKICKDFPFLIKLKKMLDKISYKMKITMFEVMTEEEEEKYFNENFYTEPVAKKENGFEINQFFQ